MSHIQLFFFSLFGLHVLRILKAKGNHGLIRRKIKCLIEKAMWDENLVEACEKGNIYMVNCALDQGAKDYDFAMGKAAENGHMDIVLFMLKSGAKDYDFAMARAARSVYMKIVSLMLNLGAKNYSWAMVEASRGGFITIVKFFMSLGASDYCSSLSVAVYEKHVDIVLLILETMKIKKIKVDTLFWSTEMSDFFNICIDGKIKIS